uniref:Cadherin domain-containing protein n=3 Tax=Octopus bimaculoides TaxID=37653 RepID=A0A0L8GW04_OCTBM
MYIMDVDQFILTTLIPGVISAEDYETPASQLVFNISKPPAPGNGFLVKLDDHTQPITSFIQDDLDSLRIGYQPPNASYSERKVYEVEFTVYDSHFSASMPIMLHIAVRPSATTAPRIANNKGLVLLEGESRPILPYNLQIVDQDNLRDVKVYVKGGLSYGQLLVNGSLSMYFMIKDIADGNVVYKHDDSDSIRDNIELRITDQKDTVRAGFPITIIPKDDTPPYIVNNLGLELNEGGIERISRNNLLAHDSDTLDSRITYLIVKTPRAGDLMLKLNPSDKGRSIKRFTQLNLLQGQIYYRHMHSGRFRDSFEFVLKDQEDQPNISQRESFQIMINSINDNPPILSPTASQFMQVQETNIGYISKSQLNYIDKDSKDSQLVYTITTPPHFVYNSKRADAGRVITTHNITMLRKDVKTTSTKSFTQEDISQLKVAYIPPENDIGTEPCLVRFTYMIKDYSGNRISGQQFDIEVQPVDNQPPEFITNKLLVEEGGTIAIGVNQISAMDFDTAATDILFVCKQLPQHGILQKNGINLKKEDSFRLEDLEEKDIRYIQDGSEVIVDSFSLTLTDGIHQVTKDINIDIVPIDDQAPRLRDGLKPHLIVSEGNDAVVTSSVLSAKDDDTDEELLTFLIVKQPRHGTLKVNSYAVTKFTQQNIKEKVVKYHHNGDEIGPTPKQDSVSFIVSDQNYASAIELPIYDLNITITPVDNQKPNILSGNQILLQEGSTFVVTVENLNAEDIDTLPRNIRFMIVKQPQWGYLENTKPTPGSGKSNAGIQINSFRLQDVLDKSINYVQTNHIGVEPLYDSVELYAMDGKLHSETKTLAINIIPTNDEVPDVMLQDFAILEGGTKTINQSIVDAIDLDVPKDPLTFSISKPPKFGKIVVMSQSKTGGVERPFRDFSIEELQNGIQLKYKHDDSENFHDRFVLVVSDSKHAVRKTCNITIIPVNDEKPIITKNSGLSLEYGNFGLISSSSLLAEDKDTNPSNLIFVLISLPKIGNLQYRMESSYPPAQARWYDFEMGANFTQDDINSDRIRYIHSSDDTQSKVDSFIFVLTDGVNKHGPLTFSFHIKNSKATKISLLNKGLKIKEGARAILSNEILSASDGSTAAEEIHFTITKAPSLGQLEYINAPFVSIKGFTQLDLAGQQVVYNHISKSDIAEDYFSFTVTNGLKYTRDDQLLIHIESQDEVLPTLEVNNPIEVIQGAKVAVSTLHLKITDPDTSVENLTYEIVKPPKFGHLYNLNNLVVHSFTQQDINKGRISYESDGSLATFDHFMFMISDGHHNGFYTNTSLSTQPVVCNIHIKSLSQDAPQLQINKSPENLESFGKKRYGFKLTSKSLRAFDSDTDSSHLLYVITKRPVNGHIENIAAKRYVHRKFTQKDLDEQSLLYIINPKTNEVNDSFSFRIEDFNGNSLENQK